MTISFIQIEPEVWSDVIL